MRRLALPLALLLLFPGCSTASIDLDTRRAPAGLHLDVVRITETENGVIQVTLALQNDSARSFVYPGQPQALPEVRVQYLTEAAWVDKSFWLSSGHVLHDDAGAGSNQCRVDTHIRQTDSITGTSTRTPTTVASAAPEPGP
jgi:hypothetical protein